jgi:hypothetical protein
LTGLVNALTGLVNAAGANSSSLQDLLNALSGSNIATIQQQTQTLAAAGNAAQLGFLASLQSQPSQNIQTVVNDIMQGGSQINFKMQEMVSKMQMRYAQASNESEKKAIYSHLQNLQKLTQSGVVTAAVKQVYIAPFTNSTTGGMTVNKQTGSPLTASEISRIIGSLSTDEEDRTIR